MIFSHLLNTIATESISIPISANNDDGYCKTNGNTWNSIAHFVELGYDSDPRHCYFRFQNVAIPVGSTILSSVLKVTGYSALSNTVCRVRIHCEEADSAAVVTSGADAVGRSLDVGVLWTIPALTTNQTVDSTNFAALLQAIINRVGWNSGQNIQIHVINDGSTPNAYRRVTTRDEGSGKYAKLLVEYS